MLSHNQDCTPPLEGEDIAATNALTKGRLKGLADVGRTLNTGAEFIAGLNAPTVVLETVTGDRMTSTTGERVPLWERLLNFGTSAGGGALFGFALRKGAKAIVKADDIAVGITKKFANLECYQCADALVAAFQKAGIKGRRIEIRAGGKRQKKAKFSKNLIKQYSYKICMNNV